MTWRRLAAVGRRYRAEATWSTLVSLLNAASFAVVPLLLARHYSPAEVGFYALMQRVALGPVSLVGAAVSQSFWAEAARLVRDDGPALERLYRRQHAAPGRVAPPLAALAAAGPLYVGLIFGIWQRPRPAGCGGLTPMLWRSWWSRHCRTWWWTAANIGKRLGRCVHRGAALTIEVAGRGYWPTLAQVVLALSLVMALMYGLLVGAEPVRRQPAPAAVWTGCYGEAVPTSLAQQ